MKATRVKEKGVLEIVGYKPEYQSWFEKINRAWIEKYFRMEPIDVAVLQHPEENIIKKGGEVLFAKYESEIVGTAALKFAEPGVFEFTKMGVDETYRGLGIGKALTVAAIREAKKRGAKKVILYSHTMLTVAIGMYRKLGFKEVPLDAVYKRCDIKMELNIV